MAQMTIRDMSYNTNNQFELVATTNVTPGSPLTLFAENPKKIFNPNPTPLTENNIDTYQFLFWNVDGKISPNPVFSGMTPTPDKPEFTCSAWYIQIGGPIIIGKAYVAVVAVAADKDQLLSGSPIDTVDPPGNWVPGQVTVDTETSAVTIDVLASVAGDPGAVFDGFRQDGAPLLGGDWQSRKCSTGRICSPL